MHNSNNGNNTQKINRRSLLISKPKSGEEFPVVVGSQKGREFEDVKAVNRSVNRAVVESYARPIRQRPTDSKNSKKMNEVDSMDGKKELQETLEQNESLIRVLKSEVLELKAELGKTESLNVELQSQNKKLSEDLAAAEAKITALNTRNQEVRITKPFIFIWFFQANFVYCDCPANFIASSFSYKLSNSGHNIVFRSFSLLT